MSPNEIWTRFQDSDINRWAFQNIDKFAPHDSIQKSGSPYQLKRELRDVTKIQFPGPGNVSLTVTEALAYLIADSLIVVKDGMIVVELLFDGMLPDTPHLLFSASKPFATAIIANLIFDGYIKSEIDLIAQYIPELAKTAFYDVTIRHLLDMQSVVDYRGLDDPSEVERASGFAPPLADENILSLALKLHRKKFPAGEKTDYNSINTDMLSLLATRITGKSAASLLHDYVFDPMGAEDDAVLIKDTKGINELGGGLAISARDLVKLGLVMLNDGLLNEQQVIPRGCITKILNSIEADKWKNGWLSSLTPQAKAYRSHLYVCADDFDKGAYFACGNFGNALYINPKNNTVAAILCSYPTGVDIQRFNTQMALLKEITNNLPEIS